MTEKPKLYVARVALWQDITREKILVGQRLDETRSQNYPNRWEFAGGKYVPPNDPGLEALRELREETNLHAVRLLPPKQPLEHTYEMEQETSKYFGWLIYTHITEAVALHPENLVAEPPEHQTLQWVTLDELEQLDLIPQTDFAVPYLREQQQKIRALIQSPYWQNKELR